MTKEPQRREDFLRKCSNQKWEILFEDQEGFQLRRKKRYSPAFAISGLILLIVGIGLIVWLIGYLEYLSRNDEIFYISKHDAYKGTITGTPPPALREPVRAGQPDHHPEKS